MPNVVAYAEHEVEESLAVSLVARYLKTSRFLDSARNDKARSPFRKARSSHGGIPALSRERAECFAAHAQGVSPCID